MRQSSEAFARAMLENEETGNSQSFTETMAQFEENMSKKIDKMQSELLGKIAETSNNVSRETLEMRELTETDETDETDVNNENNEESEEE